MAKAKKSAVVRELLANMEAKKAEISVAVAATATVYHGYSADGTFLVQARECGGCGSDHVDAETLVRETPGVEFVFCSTIFMSGFKHDVRLCTE